MRSKFSISSNQPANTVGQFVTRLTERVDNDDITQRIGKIAVSTENYTDQETATVSSVCQTLVTALESIGQDLEVDLSKDNIHAGAYAALMAGDIRDNYNTQVKLPKPGMENDGLTLTMPNTVSDIVERPTLEAFSEEEVRELSHYHAVFNMDASRQEEFGAAFYPTVVAAPDTVGLSVSAQIPVLHDDSIRNINGDETDFNRKNLLRAFADHTILNDDSTRLYPVVRTSSEKYFIDPALVPPKTIEHDGSDVKTAPLAPGNTFDILGVSQPDTMIARGVNDHTDAVHPAIHLESVYVKAGDDVLKLRVNGLMGSAFTGGFQGSSRVASLAFSNNALAIGSHTKDHNGDDLVDLDPIVAANHTVKLKVVMNGTINTTTGSTEVFANKIAVATVLDDEGQKLAESDATYATLAALFDAAEIVGYDLKAYRSNVNRRQLGKLVDTVEYAQVYPVPLRGPISAVRPISADKKADASDLNTLIVTTKISTANEAVTSLFDYAGVLRDHVTTDAQSTNANEMLGLGALLVRPTYYSDQIDMEQSVDSLVSHQRLLDIRETLGNRVRHFAYLMYTNSEYRAAYNLLFGSVGREKPVIVVGTDPMIAQYLNGMDEVTNGDMAFKIKVVTTDDTRMKGKIFISFSSNRGRAGEPDVLSFGSMGWYPELTAVTPVTRNNRVTRDLTVSPRFLHVNTLPVLTELDVIGLDKVLDKISQNTTDTP